MQIYLSLAHVQNLTRRKIIIGGEKDKIFNGKQANLVLVRYIQEAILPSQR